MRDYTIQIETTKDFINDRLIIIKDENDYVLCSDIHYFINQNKDYRDTITYRTINIVLKEYEGIYKRKFYNSMNVVGMKWRPTVKI